MTDQFGGTPLPLPSSLPATATATAPLKVWYDPSVFPGQPQQPHTQEIATFDAAPNDDCVNGSLLDVNQHFSVYAVKNALMRVVHRSSTVRTLLRGHTGERVTDVSFFQNGDVLGTVGGNVIIWRLFFRSPEIMAEKLLEIPAELPGMTRLMWHPFNPNQFWLFHRNQRDTVVATLVETTRITTVPRETNSETEAHATCQFHSNNLIMDGAVVIQERSDLTDLAWSGKDTKHVLTTHVDGTIRLWNTKHPTAAGQDDDQADNGLLPAKCIVTLEQDEAVTRCMFLPHDDIYPTMTVQTTNNDKGEGLTSAFLTASRGNSIITLWSAFYASHDPTKLQTFGLEHPAANDAAALSTPSTRSSSYNLALCFGQAPSDGSPPAFFLLLSDRTEGNIYALHLNTKWSTDGAAAPSSPKRALAVGFNYVVPFSVKFPIYSWSISCVPAEGLSDDDDDEDIAIDGGTTAAAAGLNFDMRLQVYQSKMVQQYTLPHYMVLPPSTTWNANTTPGVRVESSFPSSSSSPPVDSEDEIMAVAAAETYDEDYDLDDEAGGDDEEVQPPEASSLPVPDGLNTAGTAPATVAMGSNPFSNWLGAIAAKTTGAAGSVPPPPTPASSASTVPSNVASELNKAAPMPSMEPAAFLNPSELLSPGNTPDGDSKAKLQSSEPKKKRQDKSAKTNGGKKQAAVSSPAVATIAILKRGEEQSSTVETTAAAAVLSSSSSSTATSSDVEEVLKKTLSAHFKRQEMSIADLVQKAVKSEMQTTVIPALSKMMTQTMEQAVVKPIKSAVDKNAKERTKVQTDIIVNAVSGSVEEPLKNAFQQTMATALVPAYEAATREMLLQVASSLEKGLTPAQSDSSTVDALSAKLDAMSLNMESLSTEVAQLRSAMTSSQSVAVANFAAFDSGAIPQQDPLQVARQEIIDLLQQREYEAAFTQALSASAADMAVFCCMKANVSDVLGGSTPALSQPILLCLMQQLGAVLVSSTDDDLQTILLWLQEIALTLDPRDESIQGHVPGVLQQLVSSIVTKMEQGDPALRRPLQMLLQVIRGMQQPI